MTKLLVVGAGGMTGSELARRAPAAGFDCIALDHARLDIAKRDAVHETVERVRPDIVINAAAYTGVDGAERDAEAAMRVNGEGPGHIASAAALHGAAVIHISSDYVFDGSASSPYLPGHAPNPIGAYGRSKLAGENAAKAGARRCVIIRTSWVFSHRGHNFVRTMVKKMSAGDRLRVVNDQRGRPTAAGDLADALLVVARAAHLDSGLAGTWHFANAGVTTWYDFAREIFESRAAPSSVLEPVSTADFPAVARRPAYSVLDTTSFETTFGVVPRPWPEALRETLERIS